MASTSSDQQQQLSPTATEVVAAAVAVTSTTCNGTAKGTITTASNSTNATPMDSFKAVSLCVFFCFTVCETVLNCVPGRWQLPASNSNSPQCLRKVRLYLCCTAVDCQLVWSLISCWMNWSSIRGSSRSRSKLCLINWVLQRWGNLQFEFCKRL